MPSCVPGVGVWLGASHRLVPGDTKVGGGVVGAWLLSGATGVLLVGNAATVVGLAARVVVLAVVVVAGSVACGDGEVCGIGSVVGVGRLVVVVVPSVVVGSSVVAVVVVAGRVEVVVCGTVEVAATVEELEVVVATPAPYDHCQPSAGVPSRHASQSNQFGYSPDS